ncbi:MAG: beta-galactosidase trimerization domain-containing protein [Candidatus Acidiferrales bacterium]
MIEFHNSRHMPRLGERFDADEFGDRLLDARVDGAIVWAKDMFGYSYYPSTRGPVHPGLSFDLLGAQVAALRKRNIHVRAYYMTTWNPELARRHPEWVVVDPAAPVPPNFETEFGAVPEEGHHFLPKMCIGNEDFVQGELAQIKELVSRYEIDGLWLDGMYGSFQCYCAECLRQLRAKGLDPHDKEVQSARRARLMNSFLQRIHQVVKETRPACLVTPQSQGRYGLGDRTAIFDTSDLESLFTDPTLTRYGYYHYPTVIKYARGFGIPMSGLTSRFKGFWADFGGLKHPAQMLTEAATIVANGARCTIGDQMPPSGRLDPAVYHVIGQAYRHIERIEPYLDQAVPVSEAALITSGPTLRLPTTETNFGWVKLLTESRIQFDIVEPDAEWERYALVILPDRLDVDEATAARLHAFIARGGAVLVAHKAGLIAGTDKSWLERYGLHYAGMSPFKPAYMVPQGNLNGTIPPYEYALYEGASQWRAKSPASSLAVLGEPLFQRSAEHYTAHAQTPFNHTTDYAALARSGRVALFAFPLGQDYYNQGYWIYRQAFQKALGAVLPVPLIQSDAPLSTELTLNHQAACADARRKERYLVHIVNFSPVRGTPKYPDYHEDPIALSGVTVRVNLPLKTSKARALVEGKNLPVRRAAGGGVEVIVPRVNIHEVICFEQD